MNITEASEAVNNTVTYSFCSLVTRMDEYKDMVASAYSAGFDDNCSEFLYLDNTLDNAFDGYSGFNHFAQHAKGRYIVFCHQDVLFEFDHREQLDACLAELDVKRPDWAIAANAGKNTKGQVKLRINDPYGDNLRRGDLPAEVMSVDENFIVVKAAAGIRCGSQLKGFHLYGTELCYQANHQGFSCFVIDFHLRHKSPGKVDESYHQAKNRFIAVQKKRLQPAMVYSMCSTFYVSRNSLWRSLLNIKFFQKIYRNF